MSIKPLLAAAALVLTACTAGPTPAAPPEPTVFPTLVASTPQPTRGPEAASGLTFIEFYAEW
ncbi:MAG: hypothetical protein K1X39_10230 [Thermoflexales bacterium]|nr:hypothetical protein [Thermoflexales bacterium]